MLKKRERRVCTRRIYFEDWGHITEKNDYTKNNNILNFCLKYLPETIGQ